MMLCAKIGPEHFFEVSCELPEDVHTWRNHRKPFPGRSTAMGTIEVLYNRSHGPSVNLNP